jgi:hypothetical protein
MLFIHVLRNPLDLAAVQWEHLPNRVSEFAGIHDGYHKASRIMDRRCYYIDAGTSCTLTSDALDAVASCKEIFGQNGHGKFKVSGTQTTIKCAARGGQTQVVPWRCMGMMLWAEINSGEFVFR